MALLKKRKKKRSKEMPTVQSEGNTPAQEEPLVGADDDAGSAGGPMANVKLEGGAPTEQGDGVLAVQDSSDGDGSAQPDGPGLSEAASDDGNDDDDLMSIFESEEVENGDLSALTADLEEMDMVPLLEQAREILVLLRDKAAPS